MTTMAMGAGMLPVALDLGTDPSFRAPMAIVVIGGLITSTFLSLLVIPVVFTYVDDFLSLHWPAHPAPQTETRPRPPRTPREPNDDDNSDSTPPPARRMWQCACAGLVGPPLAGPGSREVAATAPVVAPPAYGTVEYEWNDPLRGRAVPVRLYLPVSIEPGARVPLVVFSHGIGGSRRGYSYLGSYFAANGIASLHVQHVGSDRTLWIGNPFALVGRLHDAAQEREAVNRVLDLRYALDQLLAGEHGSIIDASEIVVAGHSYGANTALLAAGARVEREGRVLTSAIRAFALRSDSRRRRSTARAIRRASSGT